jgi:iron complex outermembrane receptor protein
MTDRLSLTAGLRYTTENRGIDGYRFSYAALPAAGNTNQGLLNTVLGTEPLVFGESIAPSSITVKDTNFSKLTWRAALEYKINRDVMIYASNNRGFKSGTYNATSLGAEAVPVKPEVLDAYEVGFKSEFADHRIRVNASAFYYDYSNIQVGLITGAGVTSVENAAGAQIYGLDLDVAVAPTSNLSIRGAINLLDSKYTNYDRAQIFLPKTSAAACPSSVSTLTQAQADAIAAAPKIAGACSVALDARGLPLIFSPRFTANISPEYTIPVGDSRVDLSAAFYYNSGFDITPGGYFSHVGAYEDLSLSATYHAPHDRYFVRLWSDNVTNSNHAIYISPQSASFQEISARPISYGVTIGAKF